MAMFFTSGKRPPLFEGLPTIEQIVILTYLLLGDLAMLEVDEVCFGDAYCSMKNWQKLLHTT
jgi:hypothetical protein